jgi:hypothetical protein
MFIFNSFIIEKSGRNVEALVKSFTTQKNIGKYLQEVPGCSVSSSLLIAKWENSKKKASEKPSSSFSYNILGGIAAITIMSVVYMRNK